MTTLPPPATNDFPEESLEKQVYNIIEDLDDYLPVVNDRNRLGFSLYKYLTGEGDKPEVLVKSTKIKIEGISEDELVNKINSRLEKIKK